MTTVATPHLTRLLAATALLLAALTTAAQGLNPLNPLATPAAWALSDGAQFGPAGLTVQPGPVDRIRHAAQRDVALPAGASWRVTVKLAALRPEAADAAIGLTLHGADDRWQGVMLRPRERDLIVVCAEGTAWCKQMSLFAAAPLGPDATATHTLVVENLGGRLRVLVNGAEVGRSRVRDLELTRLGVRATRSAVLVSELRLEVLGVDDRLARLSGAREVPGAPVLMREGFEGQFAGMAQVADMAQAGASLFGRLLGSKPSAPSTTKRGNAWGDNWANANSRFERDTAAKRLRLQSLQPDNNTTQSPASTYPLAHAGVAVTARLRVAAPGKGNSGGIYLAAKTAADRKRPADLSQVYAALGDGKLWLYEYDAESDDWTPLADLPFTPPPGEVTLRLVMQGSEVWVFVDGRLMLYDDTVEPFRIGGGGLRVEGLAVLEAGSFVLSEI